MNNGELTTDSNQTFTMVSNSMFSKLIPHVYVKLLAIVNVTFTIAHMD